jgi:hypothetical protein
MQRYEKTIVIRTAPIPAKIHPKTPINLKGAKTDGIIKILAPS